MVNALCYGVLGAIWMKQSFLECYSSASGRCDDWIYNAKMLKCEMLQFSLPNLGRKNVKCFSFLCPTWGVAVGGWRHAEWDWTIFALLPVMRISCLEESRILGRRTKENTSNMVIKRLNQEFILSLWTRDSAFLAIWLAAWHGWGPIIPASRHTVCC